MQLRRLVLIQELHPPQSVQPGIRRTTRPNKYWVKVVDPYFQRTKTSMRHLRQPTTDPKYLKLINQGQDLTNHANQCLNKKDS